MIPPLLSAQHCAVVEESGRTALRRMSTGRSRRQSGIGLHARKPIALLSGNVCQTDKPPCGAWELKRINAVRNPRPLTCAARPFLAQRP